MNFQEKVKLFQIAGGEDLESGLTPLRESLLKEEIQELETAIANNDRVEILDALCDIVYVALGTCNVSGVKHNFLDTDYKYPLKDIDENIILLYYYSNKNHKDYCASSVVTSSYGLAKLFNFTLENFKTALDRVHDSNMSKFCNDEIEANETVLSYYFKGIDSYYKQNGDKWVVYRESDNKILKSILYTPVDLTDLV